MTELIDNYLDISALEKADWGCGCFIEDYILLAGILVQLKPRRILEIGTDTGLGAVIMAKAAGFMGHPAHVTTIDIDQSKGKNNLHLVSNIGEHITFVEEDSNIFLPTLYNCGEKFDFIFIDGGHDYVQACKDWVNSLKLSDAFAFHDTTQFIGLQKLIEEIRTTGIYDVFQFVSPPGHRFSPSLQLEEFSTGITLVQRKPMSDKLEVMAIRDSGGDIIPRRQYEPQHPLISLKAIKENARKYAADGNYFYELNDYDRAISMFSEAIRLYADNHEYYNGLGMALWKKNKFDDALIQFTQAYILNPNIKEIALNYATALGKNGDVQRAKLVCYLYIKKYPDACDDVFSVLLNILADKK